MQNAEEKHTYDTQPIALNAAQNEVPEDTVLDQDHVPTPRPFAVPNRELSPPEWDRSPKTASSPLTTPAKMMTPSAGSVETPRGGASKALWAVAILALLVSLVSLAINGVLVFRLFEARGTVVEGVDAAIAALDKLEGEGFHYDYHFAETIPFSGDIPFKQDMVFPFKGDIPINTVVKVPIDAGVLGRFVIDVPINTSFYVDLEVPISVDQTIHVDTEIPLDMVIPLDINLDDPMLTDQIEKIRKWLIDLRRAF